MSQLRASKAGLAACAVICACACLYLWDRDPEDAEQEAVYPAVVECGFYPDELCSALSEGKGAAPQIAQFCRNPHRPELLAHLRAPQNCSKVSRGLRFISRPLSAVEQNFSLAYIIGVRKELAMFVRLLRAIYVPQNVYCIHIDKKAPRKYKTAVQALANCLENVFISSRGRKTALEGPESVQTDLSCMSDLVQHQRPWSCVIKLCGQDFPIKTNREIIHYIRDKGNGNSITPGAKAGQSGPGPSTRGDARFKPHPPQNLTLYSGSAYYILTRKFVEFILTDARAKDMLQWLRHIQNPEQHYWVTLNRLKDAPGVTRDTGWEGHFRAIKRKAEEGDGHDGCKGHYEQDTCVFGSGDLQWIIQSPALFASKFEPSTDPLVVACLERWHRRKALRQAEVPIEPHWHFPQENHFNTKSTH
uniref:Glucosaminyl (N-acetyl) transferase family member 7 n=1 Tax=Jaculus jaculus TaxID=51337 RepID=A0A8C5L811_JACJA